MDDYHGTFARQIMTIPDIAPTHVAYDIALTLIEGVRPKTIDPLLEIFGSVYRLFSMPDDEIKMLEIPKATCDAILFGRRRKLEHAYSIFEHCSRSQINILVKGSAHYPELLTHCPDAPYILYSRGKLDFNAHRIIACVGTRNATSRAIELCQKHIGDICASLPQAAIVSGLARGIDGVAHRTAIENSIPTIAVMPGWVDEITPRSHYGLARSIINNGGAVVSEMPPETQIQKPHFVSRNRIIAGMANATIMIQSALTGGSMITANMANDYNRDVFTPAADPCDPSFAGNLSLIRSDRASILQDVSDIYASLGWSSITKPKSNTACAVDTLSAEQIEICSMMPQNEPFSIEQIIEQSSMPIAKVSSIITALEIKGIVKTLKGRLYIKTQV